MSGDLDKDALEFLQRVEDEEQRPIASEVLQIVEDAVKKVHRILSRGDRGLAASLIQHLINTKYFPVDKVISKRVEHIEATLRGEIKPEWLQEAGFRSSAKSPSPRAMIDKQHTLLLYMCRLRSPSGQESASATLLFGPLP
jgi:hypothetical protein